MSQENTKFDCKKYKWSNPRNVKTPFTWIPE